MHNLLSFLTRYHHFLLFIVLEVVCGVLFFRTATYQGSVWLSSANAVAGKTSEWRSAVENFFSLHVRNEQLTERNLLLEEELYTLRSQLLDLRGDTAAADSSTTAVLAACNTVRAKVVANEVSRHDNLITIDRGTADGIRPDQAVASGLGAVGVVYLSGEHYSVVLPLLNSHSRLSCSLRGSGYFGYLAWSGGAPTEARLNDVPRHADCHAGDWVETSGFSAIFPAGLTVGQVTAVEDSPDGLTYSLRVRLSTDFSRLRDVCVITDSTFATRRSLTDSARDSLSARR